MPNFADPHRIAFTVSCLLIIIFSHTASAQIAKTLDDYPQKVVYLNDDSLAIIDSTHFISAGVGQDGKRFSFPSLIRIPDWVPLSERPDPSARYYLYFAHHYACRYIRMAWASSLEGPWHLYQVGPFQAAGTRGVLDIGYSSFTGIGNGLYLSHHINAPHVIIDDEKQLFYLFFTSGPQVPSSTRDRFLNYRSYVAVAEYGLCFRDVSVVGSETCGVVPMRVANHYNHVFKHNDNFYGIVNMGQIWGADPDFDPSTHVWTNEAWKMHNNPIQDYYGWVISDFIPSPYDDRGYTDEGVRHPMLWVDPDSDYGIIYYSKYNDVNGEHICRALMAMRTDDPINWEVVDVDEEFMYPSLPWEGSEHPIVVTTYGGGITNRELRDPFFFRDADGRSYMVYAGGGESGIGIVEVVDPTTSDKEDDRE